MSLGGDQRNTQLPVGSQSGLLVWREDSHPMSHPRSPAVSRRGPAKIPATLTCRSCPEVPEDLPVCGGWPLRGCPGRWASAHRGGEQAKAWQLPQGYCWLFLWQRCQVWHPVSWPALERCWEGDLVKCHLFSTSLGRKVGGSQRRLCPCPWGGCKDDVWGCIHSLKQRCNGSGRHPPFPTQCPAPHCHPIPSVLCIQCCSWWQPGLWRCTWLEKARFSHWLVVAPVGMGFLWIKSKWRKTKLSWIDGANGESQLCHPVPVVGSEHPCPALAVNLHKYGSARLF